MNFEISQSKQDLIIGLFEPVIDEIVARVSKIVLSTTNREPRYYSRKETAVSPSCNIAYIGKTHEKWSR